MSPPVAAGGPPPRSPSPAGRFAAALLVLLSAFVLGPQPVQAQSAPIWEATLTVGELSGSAGDHTALGFHHESKWVKESNQAPSLTSNPFMHAGATILVEQLRYWIPHSSVGAFSHNLFFFEVSTTSSTAPAGNWKLCADGTTVGTVQLNTETEQQIPNIGSTLGWMAGQEVEVSLVGASQARLNAELGLRPGRPVDLRRPDAVWRHGVGRTEPHPAAGLALQPGATTQPEPGRRAPGRRLHPGGACVDVAYQPALVAVKTNDEILNFSIQRKLG